jgi:hypothetical protein
MLYDEEALGRRAEFGEAFEDVDRRWPPPLGAGEEVPASHHHRAWLRG